MTLRSGTYLRDVAADLKPGDVPFQPWAEALFNERKELMHAKDEPDANCLPQGVPKINGPYPFKIIQTPGLLPCSSTWSFPMASGS